MRLFVAVNPPAHLRRELDTRLDTARRRLHLAWTRPESWHLTLAFLGDWPPERLPALGQALRTAVAGRAPFVVRPGSLGAFPDLKRPRVLFLQLDGDDPLRTLAADVSQAVETVWRDGPQDRKPFHPHLTVARVKRPLAAAERALLQDLDPGSFDPFEVEAASLMSSDLRRTGARYEVVETLGFGG